ncbi:MAG: NAD-dependent epimerase/dehydratase family protein [Mediterranea massiliensis]|nr:NAD-dependent epimerase/dehydratase family protein [Mediterranea massiliensis]
MKRVLITGAGSYVGVNVENWLKKTPDLFHVESVDTFGDNWKKADYSQFDVVYHVAGIAHVNADPKMEPLYYKVNRDLTIEVAKHAKAAGVKQFIFMSSMIVYHESQMLGEEILTFDTKPAPNGFYGDSKLQAEIGLKELECDTFKVCVLRPPMIYGPNSRGNFLRLGWLATKTPIFPAWHNKRSMLYVDNLAECVKQLVLLEKSGIYYPQNRELADTVEIAQFFAKKYNHKMWVSRIFNPFVWLGSFFLQPLNKMFASYYYDPKMSEYDFEYQIVSQAESFEGLEVSEANRRLG